MTDPDQPVETAEPPEGPLPLRVGVLLLWAEAAAMLVLGLAEAVGAVVRGIDDPAVAAWVVGGPVVAALVLWQAGRLLVNRRLAGQGLGIAVQLTAVPVVAAMITGDNAPWVKVLGVAIAVVAITTAALLVAPSARAALVR